MRTYVNSTQGFNSIESTDAAPFQTKLEAHSTLEVQRNSTVRKDCRVSTRSFPDVSMVGPIQTPVKVPTLVPTTTSDSLQVPVKYPQRPGQENCEHYLKTGTCDYGASCIFNHPVRTDALLRALNRRECFDFIQRGHCNYGSKCKYTHPFRNQGRLHQNPPVGSHSPRENERIKFGTPINASIPYIGAATPQSNNIPHLPYPLPSLHGSSPYMSSHLEAQMLHQFQANLGLACSFNFVGQTAPSFRYSRASILNTSRFTAGSPPPTGQSYGATVRPPNGNDIMSVLITTPDYTGISQTNYFNAHNVTTKNINMRQPTVPKHITPLSCVIAQEPSTQPTYFTDPRLTNSDEGLEDGILSNEMLSRRLSSLISLLDLEDSHSNMTENTLDAQWGCRSLSDVKLARRRPNCYESFSALSDTKIAGREALSVPESPLNLCASRGLPKRCGHVGDGRQCSSLQEQQDNRKVMGGGVGHPVIDGNIDTPYEMVTTALDALRDPLSKSDVHVAGSSPKKFGYVGDRRHSIRLQTQNDFEGCMEDRATGAKPTYDKLGLNAGRK